MQTETIEAVDPKLDALTRARVLAEEDVDRIKAPGWKPSGPPPPDPHFDVECKPREDEGTAKRSALAAAQARVTAARAAEGIRRLQLALEALPRTGPAGDPRMRRVKVVSAGGQPIEIDVPTADLVIETFAPVVRALAAVAPGQLDRGGLGLADHGREWCGMLLGFSARFRPASGKLLVGDLSDPPIWRLSMVWDQGPERPPSNPDGAERGKWA